MCTYNGERYVLDQLESFVRQTKRPDELIVCDDASTDRTAEIVTAFARSAPFPVRLVAQPANIGRIANFDDAISRCTKDIIFLSDQDDVWLGEKIQVMVGALCSAPHAGGVFCDAEVVDRRLASKGYSSWRICRFTPALQDGFQRGEAFAISLRRDVVQGACLAFRSACRPLLLPLAPEWGHDSWIAILLAASSRLVLVEEKLVLWRQHESNLLGTAELARPLAKKWLGKLREPRQYFRGKLDSVDYHARMLNQLEQRLASQNEPQRYATHMVLIEQRRQRLDRRRWRVATLLRALGHDARRAT